MKNIPVVPASVTRRLWIKPSYGRLPRGRERGKERGILKKEREGWKEIDDEEEIELCSIHPHVRFMVDIIDVSILVVITVRVCGMFLIMR